jgi:hypothetical protein
MNRWWCALLVSSASALAQHPQPEECLAGRGDAVVEVATHGGREYRFKLAGCRSEFESDPERFSQLYDALLEMQAAGYELKPTTPSLVPS